jgi:hypothetical protein
MAVQMQRFWTYVVSQIKELSAHTFSGAGQRFDSVVNVD